MDYPLQILSDKQEIFSDITSIHIGDMILTGNNNYNKVKAYINLNDNLIITYGKWKKKIITNKTFFVQVTKNKLLKASDLTTNMYLTDISGNKHIIQSIEETNQTIKYPITEKQSFVCNKICISVNNTMTKKNKLFAIFGF